MVCKKNYFCTGCSKSAVRGDKKIVGRKKIVGLGRFKIF